MRRLGGFTLVELLVVLAVIGLAGAAVLLTLPAPSDSLGADADGFAARLSRARDEAILGTRAVIVTATAQGHGVTRQRFGGWQPLDERPFGTVLWHEDVRPQLPRSREQLSFRFDPTGATDAASLTLRQGNRAMRVEVDATGQVQVDAAPR